MIESKVFDFKLRNRGEDTSDTKVGILAIDERSLSKFGRWPFSRKYYARAFDTADRVLLAPVDNPEKAPEGQRMDVPRLVADIGARAQVTTGVDEIIEILGAETAPGDVVLIMSNGAFGGIYQRLPETLAAHTTIMMGS